MKEIEKKQIRKYWKFINPNDENFKFQVFKKDGTATKPTDVDNAEKLIELCKEHNLEGLSCLSINPREKNITGFRSVSRITDIFIDVDVKKERRENEVLSTLEDKKMAKKVMENCVKKLESQINFRIGMLVDSGNGYHIHIPVNIEIPSYLGSKEDWDQSVLKNKLASIEDILEEFENDVVEIDVLTKDIVRRVKIPGTWNVKEGMEEKDYRQAEIIKINEEISMEDNNRVFYGLKPKKGIVEAPIGISIDEKIELDDILSKDKKSKDLFEGNLKGYGYKSRSEAELALAIKLIQYGMPESKIRMVMSKSKIGRWIGSKRQYQDITIKKAYLFITQRNKEQGQQRKQRKQNKIKGAGGVFGNLVIEPLGDMQYLYSYKGKKGIARAGYDEETKKYHIDIENEDFTFSSKPLKDTLFRTPSFESVEAYINGEYGIKTSKELFDNIITYLKILYDIKPSFYYYLIGIGILESWSLLLLQAVFYLGFEAKHGGAKTSALEGLSIISRHGYLAGNISSAGVARLTSKFQFTLFADELDTKSKSKDNETYEIFRIGYRRNNPYTRLKDSRHDFEEDISDVFGMKCYSIYSDIEKALKDRSIMIPLRISKDTTLPILNLYKEQIGFPLFEDLFFWYIENIVALVSLQQNYRNNYENVVLADSNRSVVSLVSDISLVSRNIAQSQNDEIKKIRESLFSELTKDFSKKEIDTLSKFFGRNEELFFIAIKVCKAFDIDVLKVLEKAFIQKEQSDETYSDNYLIQLLREELIDTYNNLKENDKFILKKGEFENYVYCRKTDVYERYRIKLKDNDIRPVSQSTFKEYLMELGFDEGINVQKERFGNKAYKALIFDDVAKKTLDITEETVTNEEIIEKCEKVMLENPAHEWYIGELMIETGMKENEIKNALLDVTSKLDNATPIRRKDEKGDCYILKRKELEESKHEEDCDGNGNCPVDGGPPKDESDGIPDRAYTMCPNGCGKGTHIVKGKKYCLNPECEFHNKPIVEIE